jgi:hypothetical protein
MEAENVIVKPAKGLEDLQEAAKKTNERGL